MISLKHVDRARFELLLVTLGYGHGPLPELCRRLGVKVIELQAGRLRNLWGLTRTIFRLVRVILSSKVDIVLSNELHPHVYGRLAALLTGRPTVCWIQNLYQWPLRQNGWLPKLSFLLSSDYWIANSQASAVPLRKLFPGKEIEVVYPGVDLNGFTPRRLRSAVRKELGIGPGERVVALAGRLQPWKGQEVFLQAAAVVAKKFPKARFLLIGAALFGMDDGYPEKLRKSVQDLGLGSQVLFTGFRTDMADVLNSADVLVHASTSPEPFGRVIVEAMALGKPVVATDLGGPREIITDGINGILVPPGDRHALATALQRLLKSQALQRRLGAAGRRSVRARFNAQAMTVGLQHILSDAAKREQL